MGCPLLGVPGLRHDGAVSKFLGRRNHTLHTKFVKLRQELQRDKADGMNSPCFGGALKLGSILILPPYQHAYCESSKMLVTRPTGNPRPNPTLAPKDPQRFLGLGFGVTTLKQVPEEPADVVPTESVRSLRSLRSQRSIRTVVFPGRKFCRTCKLDLPKQIHSCPCNPYHIP